jgi:hypothetical protein
MPEHDDRNVWKWVERLCPLIALALLYYTAAAAVWHIRGILQTCQPFDYAWLWIGLGLPPCVDVLVILMALTWKRTPWDGRLLTVLLLLPLLAAVIFSWSPAGGQASADFLDFALRRKVENSVGIANLQRWAEEQLNAPRGSSDHIPREAWPAGLDQFPNTEVLIIQRSYEPLHVEIWWGGGFHSWGIFVGPPSYRAESDDHTRVTRWCDGVYSFQGE